LRRLVACAWPDARLLASPSLDPHALRTANFLGPNREEAAETASLSGRALDLDVTAKTVQDPIDRRKAEPGPLVRGLGREKGLKEACPHLLVHPDAVIAHGEREVFGRGAGARVFVRFDGRCEGDVPASRHRIACVHGEVQEYLFEPGPIGQELGFAGVQPELESDLLAEEAREDAREVHDDLIDVKEGALDGVAACEREELARELR